MKANSITLPAAWTRQDIAQNHGSNIPWQRLWLYRFYQRKKRQAGQKRG